MLPFCRDTATVYHYAGDDLWESYILRKIKWRGLRSHRMSGGIYESKDAPVMIVPADANLKMTADGRDYVVFGVGKPLSKDYTMETLRRECAGVWVIASIEDHTRAPFLRHWRVTLN